MPVTAPDLGRPDRPAVAHRPRPPGGDRQRGRGPRCAPTRWASTPVIDGFGPDEWSTGRGQVLAPWPNRLADGRYEFNGVRAQAALDEPERRNAIHGLVRWLPWTLQTRHQNQLALRLQLHPSPGYPFSLLLELEYHVGRDGLTVTTAAQSLDERPSRSAWASTPT